MPSPAFLIEGHMEKKILQKICPGAPIRRIGCNGDRAPMSVLAKFVETQIRVLNNRNFPIVIIFDRERREATCDELKEMLRIELDAKGFNGQCIIGIADRTIENWILSDNEVMVTFGGTVADAPYEGKFGKSEIKSALGQEANYHETTLGVEMFLKCNPQTMYDRSLSFRALMDQFPDCAWFSRAAE